MYSLTFHFSLSWTEAVSSLRLNWHLSYYFLLLLVIMESISVLYGCCIARLSVLSPHYTEMVSKPLEDFRLLNCHLTFRYDIYIYLWLEGRAGATQIRFRSQSGTWAAVVLLAVWAQQLQKMFSLSIPDWLIKVGISANQKVLIKNLHRGHWSTLIGQLHREAHGGGWVVLWPHVTHRGWCYFR